MARWAKEKNPNTGHNEYCLSSGPHFARVSWSHRDGWEAHVLVDGAGGWSFTYATSKRHAMRTAKKLLAKLTDTKETCNV